MPSSNQKKRRILISPLNWGLGHATRLIPIIDELVKAGHYCLIAGESPSIDILLHTFPQLPHAKLKGFNVRLSKHRQQWPILLYQIPTLLKAIKQEHIQTQSLVKKHKIDLIISDNRYGVRSKEVTSIIITHQTRPQLGKVFNRFQAISNKAITQLISKFDACWIPDTEIKPNLSGHLSEPIKTVPTEYLGIKSRLSIANSEATTHEATDILVILSGPEPHRSQLEEILINQLINSKRSVTIVRGKLDSKPDNFSNITLLPHCKAADLKLLICQSKFIICRSGYSTLMDLVYCNKRALLIPTPGQYEQEYLAKRASSLFGFSTVPQNRITHSNIFTLLESSSNKSSSPSIIQKPIPHLPI